MIIQGPLKSGKTTYLLDELMSLIASGVKTSDILVLTLNSFKKKIFTEKFKDSLIKSGVEAVADMPVYTFNGIVYHSILNNWPLVEELIPENIGEKQVLPELSGLETTQWLLKECINKTNFSGYMSKFNLYHQLLRRYKLITDNALTDDEVEHRSSILNEIFALSAKIALSRLKLDTSKLRSFDNIKQVNTFLHLLKAGKINDFKDIKYVFVDDIDEMTPSAQFFIKYLISNAQKSFVAIDKDGGSRRGYLAAFPEIWDELKDSHELKTLESKKEIFNDVNTLFNNIKYNENNNINNIEITSTINRTEMIEGVIDSIDSLLSDNVNPSQISIVTPLLDENIKYALKDYFLSKGIECQYLSGSKKLIDDPIVFASLVIARLINSDWKLAPSAYDLRFALVTVLNIPVVSCQGILDKYKKSRKKLLPEDIELDTDEYTKRYIGFVKTINELLENPTDLHSQLVEIFTRLILPLLDEDIELENFNNMLKSLDEFLTITRDYGKDNIEKEWIQLIQNQVVSDNPISAPDINQEAVIIATPQKIIDFEIERDIQIWLDVSDRAWTKEDIGPLYNAWVLRKNWDDKDDVNEVTQQLTRDKAAHVMRKLMLCANKKIYAFNSEIDSSGNETSGHLHTYLNSKNNAKILEFKEINPRDDQKPVLEYKKGKMAVPAVPGAGKTTIMQALIIELLKRNIKPGEILVLTYMESAAKNFLERIKKSCPNLNELPQISTIHGLAFKIIQDEDNHVKLGLDANFSICDDTARPKIIDTICQKYLPFGEDGTKWTELNAAAISRAKIAKLNYKTIEDYLKNNTSQQLEEFLPVYREYEIALRNKNLIDYDDLLVMATWLLKEYKHIRQYYQSIFKYVIEDEAQDSSSVQQEFINILSQKNGNLIRCGDVNQAITTTFTNADVKGFKEFIANNPQVEMQSSQRCAKEVYELANYLIDWSLTNEHTQNAFYDIKMQPVERGNPIAKDSLNFRILENNQLEKQWVLSEIKDRLKSHPDETFGVLLRSNWQVYDWATFLETNGVKTLCRTDTLKQKKVFTFILKLLEVLESPWNNKLIAELYEEFGKAKLIKFKSNIAEFIKTQLGTPFITYTVGSNQILQLESQELASFWWDIHYWLENSHISPEELVVKIGNYYFDNVLDKSNAYLLSILIRRYINNFEQDESVKLPQIIKHFKQMQNKNRVSGVKFFTEADKNDSLGGYVQVMTMHKAKGDEFETVFIPEMHESEFSYAITPENIKIKDDNILFAQINELSGHKKKTNQELILEQIEETLRLIYVGITRAEKHLYMTSSYKKITKYGKSYDAVPSSLLEHFIDMDFKTKEVEAIE